MTPNLHLPPPPPGRNNTRVSRACNVLCRYVSPYYDSLLVKVTATGINRARASNRMLRALSEFKVRGLKTNIEFLQNVIEHPKFIVGNIDTSFIVAEAASLFSFKKGDARRLNLLKYFGDMVVNGPRHVTGMVSEVVNMHLEAPILSQHADCHLPPTARGFKQIIDEEGPEAYAKALRANPGCLMTDTTWRDAHQSLLMTRMRTIDIARVATQTAHALGKCASLECWGGATFDVSLRFLHECPWRRLKELRKLVPNIPFQMLLRGANAVGWVLAVQLADAPTAVRCSTAR